MKQRIVQSYRAHLHKKGLIKLALLAAVAMFLATSFIMNDPADAQSTMAEGEQVLASSNQGKIPDFEDELNRYRTAYSNADDDKKQAVKKSYNDLEKQATAALDKLKTSYSAAQEKEVSGYLSKMENLLKDVGITIPKKDDGDNIGVISPDPPGEGGGGGDDGDGSKDDGSNEGTWSYHNPDRGPTTKFSKYNNPRAYVQWAKESSSFSQACEYLTFCRWWNATMFPSPDSKLVNVGQVATGISGAISFVALHLVTVLALIFGWGLGMASSLMIFDRLVYVMDGVYADMGRVIFFQNTTGSELPLFIVIFIWSAIIAGLWLGFSRFRLIKNRQIDTRIGMRKIGWTIGVLIFVGLSSYQAQFNHPDKTSGDVYPVAEDYHGKNSDGDEDVVGKKILDEEFSFTNAISDWAPASPGWFISIINYGADVVGKIVGQSLGVVGTTINYSMLGDDQAAKVANTTECDAYVEGMHDLFNETSFAQKSFFKNNSILISYDNIIKELHFDSYSLATFGQNQGAGATWCRSAELQTNRTASEQVALSRVAGLYPEAIGWGRLGLDDSQYPLVNRPPGTRGEIVDTGEGYFITEDGDWKTGDTPGEWLANGVFGPTFTHPRGGDASLYMFAACRNTVTESMSMREDWGMVIAADSDDKLLTVDSCRRGFGSEGDKAVGTEGDPPKDNEGAEGDEDGFVDTIKKAGEIAKSLTKDPIGSASKWFQGDKPAVNAVNGLNEFNYSNANGSPVVGGVGGILSSESSVKFSQTQYAFDFFRTSQGADPGSTAFFAVNSLVAIIFFAKYFAGLLMGGLGAEVLASVLSMFIFLVLLITAIPIDRTRRIGAGALMAYLYAAVASTIAIVIIQTALLISELFKTLTIGVFGGIPLLSQIATAVAVIGGFWATNRLLNLFFPKGEFDGWRNQLNTMGGAAGYPILHAAGFNPPNVLSGEFWGRKKDPSDETAEVKTEAPGTKTSDASSKGDSGVFKRTKPDAASKSGAAPKSGAGALVAGTKEKGKNALNAGTSLAANKGIGALQDKAKEKFGMDANGNTNVVGQGIDGMGNFLRSKVGGEQAPRDKGKDDFEKVVNFTNNTAPSQTIDSEGNVISDPMTSQKNAFGNRSFVNGPDGTFLVPEGNVADDATSGLSPSGRTSRMDAQDVRGDMERVNGKVLSVRSDQPVTPEKYVNNASTTHWDSMQKATPTGKLEFISRALDNSAPLPESSRSALDEVREIYREANGVPLQSDKEALAYAAGTMGVGSNVDTGVSPSPGTAAAVGAAGAGVGALGLSGMAHLVDQGRSANEEATQRVTEAMSKVGSEVQEGVLRAFQSREFSGGITDAYEYMTARAIDSNYNPSGLFPDPVWDRAETLREWMDTNDMTIDNRMDWPMEQREAFESIANDMKDVFNITPETVASGNIAPTVEPQAMSQEFVTAIDDIFTRDYARRPGN